MHIDPNLYKRSIAPHQVWKFVLLFAIAYFLFTAFTDSIDTFLVDKLLSHFPQTILSDILCLAFLFYIFLKVGEVVRNKLLPTIASMLFSCLIILFYLLLIRRNGNYSYYAFQLCPLHWIKYADFLSLLFCIYILDFRAFHKSLQKQSFTSLIADEPDPDNITDLIENESYVQKIALTINETTGRTAYGIGVFSSWGSGKTDFLLRLKKKLQSNSSENIVLEFNPWKAASTESVLEDFFAVLSRGLKRYNKSITGKLKGYSKKILSTGKEIQYRLADTILEELIKDPTLQERYEQINETIRQTGKRLIIVIDDLDRMTGMEILQVLRVIRNSANFSNTFFIVALDHEYIVNVMNKTGQFAKEEQYLKKIFQLIVTLPQIRKGTFSSEIINLLTTKEMLPEDKDKIEKAVSILKFDPTAGLLFGSSSPKDEGNLEKMLANYRDVKRFCNSFKINFNILKDEVEITDLFLMELIKTKSFYAYELIANKTLLTKSSNTPYVYQLSDEGWKYFNDTSKLDSYTLNDIKSALTYLLGESSVKGSRQFSYPHNFYLYFSYQLFSLISLQAFQAAIELPPKKMREKLDQWTQEGKQNDLQRILDDFSEYRDKAQFEKFLRAFLAYAGKSDFTGRAKEMVMAVDKNSSAYFGDKEKYVEFIRSLLADNTLPEYNRAYVANELLKHSIYNAADLLLPKQELQEIIYSLFDKYLSSKQEYDDTVYSFYLFNDDHRQNNYVFLNPKAHNRMFEFLSIPQIFDGYLRFLIRSRSLPTEGEFVFAPFTKDIFRDWKTFKEMVEKHQGSDEKIKALMRIIIKYTDNYTEGKDRFRLEGEELVFVLDHLRSTKQYNF